MAWQVSGRGFGAALAAPPVTARIGRRLGLATADLRRYLKQSCGESITGLTLQSFPEPIPKYVELI
jgi:hypothetical protein